MATNGRDILHPRRGQIVAIAATAVATAARWLLDPALGDNFPFITFFLAIGVTAWYGGSRPALLATVLGLIVSWYVFLPTRLSFTLADRSGWLGLVIFLAVGLALALLGGAMHAAQRRSRASEQLARRQEELIGITLASIADAVIATDAEGRVTFLNAAAQKLTGWSQADAAGKTLERVFVVRNEETGAPVENPAQKVLELGRAVGLANHTVLIARDGTERPIDDSAAPIRDDTGRIMGVVLVFRDVSEQRQAELKLRRSERELSEFFENAPMGLNWLAADGRILRVNRAELAMLGYDEAEYVGRNIADFHVDGETITDILRHLQRGQPVQNREARLRRKDGSLRTVLINANAQREEGRVVRARCLTLDVTALREAEHARRQLAAIVESSEDAIVSKDLNGIVTSWNRGAEQVFGYGAEEMIGQPIARLIPEDHLDEEPSILQRIRLGVRVEHYETVRRRKDGTLIPVSLSVSPIFDERGRVVGASKIARDISERRRVEEEARRADQQLRLITDALPALISFVDADGRYLLNNRAYEAWFHRPRSEITGRHMRDVVGDSAWSVIGPKIEAALAGQVVSYETEVVYKDSSKRWINATYTPHFGADNEVTGVAVLVNDISERRWAQEALRRWEHVFQHAGWPVVIVNPDDNRFQAVNAAFSSLHGYAPEELIGKPWADTLAPESRVEASQHARMVHEHGDLVYESIHLRKDGSRFPCLTHETAFRNDHGRVVYRAATFQDLTAIRAAEQDLLEAGRRKDEFLATLAHELRNPLAPIRNAVHLLQHKGTTDPELTWGIDLIDRQVRIMVRLLEDLLDVSRVSRNKLEIRKERVQLAEVVRVAVETSRPLIASGKHELTVELPDEPVLLDADPMRLAQVLSNLLNNAAKYTDRGGHVRLSAERQGDEVRVSVRDDGIGIDPEMLPRIFEIFSQAKPALERAQGGLGIGLSLVRALVELHGGTVEAHSPGTGLGSEFVVRLPVAQGPAPVAEVGAAGGPSSAARRRVLVVDDKSENADSLAVMLRLKGHEVHTAYDGERGLLAAAELRPEVVLLDLGMPGLNGYELCRRIRAQDWGRSMTLVALTGWGQAEDRRNTEEAGFDHHLVKPVAPEALHTLLASPPVET